MIHAAYIAWAVIAAGGSSAFLHWFYIPPTGNRWTAVVCSFILANAYIVGRILGG